MGGTLADALVKAGYGRGDARTVCQVRAEIRNGRSLPAEEAFDDGLIAVVEGLKQACSDAQMELPADVWEARSAERRFGPAHLAVAYVPEERRYAARLELPDARSTRSMIVDYGLYGSGEGPVRFGARLTCVGVRPSEHVPQCVPQAVRLLAGQGVLHLLRPISDLPWVLQTEDDLIELQLLLEDQQRELPVILLSRHDSRRTDVTFRHEYVLDPDALARQVVGIAHVVVIPHELGYRWTERVGKAWSAYHGAVRTYRTGLDFSTDDPRRHPLALVDAIAWCRYNDLYGEAAYQQQLADSLFAENGLRLVDWHGVMFLDDTRRKQLKLSRAGIESHAELLDVADEEIRSLETSLATLRSDYARVVEQLRCLDEDARVLRGQNFHLRSEVDRLRQRLGSEGDEETPIPEAFSELSSWASRWLTGRLVILQRALRNVKAARYADAPLAYRCLVWLATTYRQSRMLGQAEDVADLRMDAKATLGVELRRAITPTRAGEASDQYYVNYRCCVSGHERRCLLDWHLCKGTDMDEAECLRIYFFWDAETNHVVVGWLPNHLQTRLSN